MQGRGTTPSEATTARAWRVSAELLSLWPELVLTWFHADGAGPHLVAHRGPEGAALHFDSDSGPFWSGEAGERQLSWSDVEPVRPDNRFAPVDWIASWGEPVGSTLNTAKGTVASLLAHVLSSPKSGEIWSAQAAAILGPEHSSQDHLAAHALRAVFPTIEPAIHWYLARADVDHRKANANGRVAFWHEPMWVICRDGAPEAVVDEAGYLHLPRLELRDDEDKRFLERVATERGSTVGDLLQFDLVHLLAAFNGDMNELAVELKGRNLARMLTLTTTSILSLPLAEKLATNGESPLAVADVSTLPPIRHTAAAAISELDPRLARLVEEIGGDFEHMSENGAVNFTIGDHYFKATPVAGTDRVELVALIGVDTVEEVDGWIARQPAPLIGRLERWGADTDEQVMVALTFWRPIEKHPWGRDPLGRDVRTYSKAWELDTTVSHGERVRPVDLFRVGGPEFGMNPAVSSPANAWLVMGSEESLLSSDELSNIKADAELGDFSTLWTASKQTLEGDLLLFYFTKPIKEVRYVARAASAAFQDPTLTVNAEGVHHHPWWISTTPPIEIKPIPYQDLQSVAQLVMRGGSGKYLRPDVIEQLGFTASDVADVAELARVVQRPVGIPDVPGTALMTLGSWRATAGGTFKKEADVTRHVAMPLLRWISPTGAAIAPEFAAAGGRADLVLLHEDRPILTVEVKLGINLPPDGHWRNSPDLAQLRRYVGDLRTPGVLIDANRIAVVPFGASTPEYVLERAHVTDRDLDGLRELVRSSMGSH